MQHSVQVGVGEGIREGGIVMVSLALLFAVFILGAVGEIWRGLRCPCVPRSRGPHTSMQTCLKREK